MEKKIILDNDFLTALLKYKIQNQPFFHLKLLLNFF